MEVQIITLVVHTDMPADQLLDVAHELGNTLEETIDSYDYEARVHEEEISVEDGDSSIYGGE